MCTCAALMDSTHRASVYRCCSSNNRRQPRRPAKRESECISYQDVAGSCSSTTTRLLEYVRLNHPACVVFDQVQEIQRAVIIQIISQCAGGTCRSRSCAIPCGCCSCQRSSDQLRCSGFTCGHHGITGRDLERARCCSSSGSYRHCWSSTTSSTCSSNDGSLTPVRRHLVFSCSTPCETSTSLRTCVRSR